MNFHCEPEYKIGLCGSFFLLGMVIGCLTFARLGDIHGRKPIFIIGMTIILFVMLAMTFTHNYLFVYFLLFCYGIACAGK